MVTTKHVFVGQKRSIHNYIINKTLYHCSGVESFNLYMDYPSIQHSHCLKYDIVLFIIGDNNYVNYCTDLNQWNTERGYLTDTCLTAQGEFKKHLDYFHISYR